MEEDDVVRGVIKRDDTQQGGSVMTWFTANWFWVLIFIAFIAMHMFGHGGHGGHSGHGGG